MYTLHIDRRWQGKKSQEIYKFNTVEEAKEFASTVTGDDLDCFFIFDADNKVVEFLIVGDELGWEK